MEKTPTTEPRDITAALSWKRSDWLKREFLLSSKRKTLASLRFHGAFTLDASLHDAVTGETAVRITRNAIIFPRFTFDMLDSSLAVVKEVKTDWLLRARIALPDGTTYQWRPTNMWAYHRGIFDADDNLLIEFKRNPFSTGGEILIHDDSPPVDVLNSLIYIGWYLLLYIILTGN